MTIVYVEDEAIISIAITEDLEKAGYTVESHVTCVEAFEFVKDNPLTVLITDINTPGGMDGWELAIKAREIHPDLPVIYTTAFGRNSDKIVKGGVYLPKPFAIEDMLEEIDKIMV